MTGPMRTDGRTGGWTGGQLLVDALKIHGADHVFCVPGESYLAMLDALYDAPEIAVTVCRQEGGAAMMADAYGRLTGRPGVCMVTRGPGATNASAGVHIAFQDSTPMLLLIGQVARDQQDREAFQEIDYRRMFGQMAKWTAQIDRADRVPEYLSRAFHTATSGRPGPVVLALPEDMLRETVAAPAAGPSAAGRYKRVEAHPGPGDMAALKDRLRAAARPLVVLGGGGWSQQACADLETFASAWSLPVAASFRCQDYMNNDNPHYVGDVGIGVNPALARRVADADPLLAIGARMGEITTGGYTLLDIPRPKQGFVHVYPGAEELGRVYQADLPINASVGGFLAAVKELAPDGPAVWADWTAQARAEYETWNGEPPVTPGDLQIGQVVRWLRDALPEDAVICNGAGNYTAWIHRFHRYRRFGAQLAPTSGSMGYGTPAAVAAKRIQPERTVVAFAGDGCFLMNGQELATAVQYGANIIVIVVNNGMYGTIRMHQERDYPGRVCATDLVNPDFAKLAQAYGCFGAVVTRTEAFAPAFERALAAGTPALLELRVDPEAIAPKLSLSEIRGAGRKG